MAKTYHRSVLNDNKWGVDLMLIVFLKGMKCASKITASEWKDNIAWISMTMKTCGMK